MYAVYRLLPHKQRSFLGWFSTMTAIEKYFYKGVFVSRVRWVDGVREESGIKMPLQVLQLYLGNTYLGSYWVEYTTIEN